MKEGFDCETFISKYKIIFQRILNSARNRVQSLVWAGSERLQDPCLRVHSTVLLLRSHELQLYSFPLTPVLGVRKDRDNAEVVRKDPVLAAHT